MSKSEKTGKRPSVFSLRHREQTQNWFLISDIDWIAYNYVRNNVHYHESSYIKLNQKGEKMIIHASFDEKMFNYKTSDIDARLNDSSVQLQSIMPWPSFCMFIDTNYSFFYIIALNSSAENLFLYLKKKINPDIFKFDDDYCAFVEPNLNNDSYWSNWSEFEENIRNYSKRLS